MEQIETQDTLWAGTDSSHVEFLRAMTNNAVRMQAGTYPSNKPQDVPYLLEQQGSVGVISIKGPMSNTTSYWDEMDKSATYTAIREAMIHAAQEPTIQHIILDINSGGGAVSGVADVASLITTVNESVKPVTAFTDGNMMSAAYWLGSAAGQVFASKVAGVGSIGIIATHADQSKMLADMGINVTVLRAGKYKALANKFEPLSKEAEAQIQASLDAAYGVFVQQVADNRGVPYAVADTKMAQGQEFFGEQALKAGLVDGISTFDSLMSVIQRNVDITQSVSHNSQNITKGNVMKKALSTQEIAAMAAGILPADAGTEETEAEKTARLATEAAALAASTEAARVASEAETARLAAAGVAAGGDTNVVAYLQGQVKEKDAALLASAVELTGLKAKIADGEASLSGLIKIAATSVNHMRVALGGSALDMSAMSATAILAEHASFSKQFQEKYVAGGVAAVDATSQTENQAATSNSFQQARVAATRSTPRKAN